MSFTITLLPIIAALLAPEGKFLPNNTIWYSVNPTQEIFLSNYFSKKDELKNFSEKEIRYWASNDYKFLNKIAKDNAFDIQLSPFAKSEFGSLSILEIIIEWLQKGRSTQLSSNNKQYKAVSFKNTEIFNVYEVNASVHAYPIIELQTKGKDKVFMAIADQELSDFNLLDKVNKIKSLNREQLAYDEIIFPCVELDQELDIKWLLNIQTGGGWFIAQALQQTKFKMNEFGAKVKSAVMLGMCKSIGPRNIKQLVIDKPFYIWIERENCTMPIFVGYIDQQHWECYN